MALSLFLRCKVIIPPPGEDDRHIKGLSVTPDSEHDALAHDVGPADGQQIGVGADAYAVRRQNYVALLQPRFLGAEVFRDGIDHRVGRTVGKFRLLHVDADRGQAWKPPVAMISLMTDTTRLDGTANPRPSTVAEMSDRVLLIFSVLMPMTWPYSLISGPPELPLFRGSGGLEQRHHAALHGDGTVDGGDDALGQCAPQLNAQRVADGVDRIAHLAFLTVAQRRSGQAGGVHRLQQCQILGAGKSPPAPPRSGRRCTAPPARSARRRSHGRW